MHASVQPVGGQPPERFEFTGSGGEYFRIWIVNLLLTILTLGVYSAWAKVRRLKYFSRHTRLAGSVFDYHGSPIAILIGRLIALVLLVIYSLATSVPGPALLVALAVIGLVLPWMLRNSFRFRLRNTSYRGLRFSFRGSLGESYLTFLLFGVLAFVTLYLLAPLFHHRIKAYQHGRAWFGQTPFSFNASIGGFFLTYLAVGAVFLVGAFVLALMFGGTLGALGTVLGPDATPDPALIMPLLAAIFVGFLVLSLLVAPMFQAWIGNRVWNGTRLGEHRFECRLRVLPLLWIGLSNFVLIVLSVGLFIPWAAVRMARYRASCMTLLPAAPLDAFLAATAEEIGAIGEETAEMFDVDIGL